MAPARAVVAALLLALAVAPSQQLPAGLGMRRLRSAGGGPSSLGGAGGSGALRLRRRLAAAPPLTPTSTQVQEHDVLYQVPQNPVGLVVLLHKCGRNAGGQRPLALGSEAAAAGQAAPASWEEAGCTARNVAFLWLQLTALWAA